MYVGINLALLSNIVAVEEMHPIKCRKVQVNKGTCTKI